MASCLAKNPNSPCTRLRNARSEPCTSNSGRDTVNGAEAREALIGAPPLVAAAALPFPEGFVAEALRTDLTAFFIGFTIAQRLLERSPKPDENHGNRILAVWLHLIHRRQRRGYMRREQNFQN